MADAKKDAADGGAPPPRKKKLLLILIVAVLTILIAAAAALVLLMKKPAEEEDEEAPPAKTAKAKKKAPAGPPVFVKLDPFVVKLQAENQETYAQAIPEFKLADALFAEQVKQFMPEIRHRVLLILAGKRATELSTPEGMQALANQIREAVNAILTGKGPDPAREKLDSNDEGPVVAVFFSSLIVQ